MGRRRVFDGSGLCRTKGVSMTTVQKVNGISPVEWQSDTNNVYCGRSFDIKSGKYAGQEWHTQGWGNPFKLYDFYGRAEKTELLFHYVRELALKLSKSGMLLNQFKELYGRNLGCWCVNWDGHGEVPLCHAAWLARIVDILAVRPAVLVSPFGHIQAYSHEPVDVGIMLEMRDRKLVSMEFPRKLKEPTT